MNAESLAFREEIIMRANNASEKVKEKIIKDFIPKLEKMGDMAEGWLGKMENDFYALAEDPNDESGGGNYAGWSGEEVKEFYKVLYGRELE